MHCVNVCDWVLLILTQITTHSSRRARCLSVVAILTLEITGIPAVSSDEETVLPWPKPSFVEKRTRGHLFEVCFS